MCSKSSLFIFFVVFFQETDQQIEKEKENAENLKAELWKCGGAKIKIGDQKKCVTKNPTVLSPDDVEKIGGDLKERLTQTHRMENLDACELSMEVTSLQLMECG